MSPWERLKIGGGTPPILPRHGWLGLYCRVHDHAARHSNRLELCYSAGVMMLTKERPRGIRDRSAEPVLRPVPPHKHNGASANAVFPSGIDQCDDLGLPNRFDGYYGMADTRISVARRDVPEHLPQGVSADGPDAPVERARL